MASPRTRAVTNAGPGLPPDAPSRSDSARTALVGDKASSVVVRDPFSKLRCLSDPSNGYDTLEAWARVVLVIEQAQDVLEDGSWAQADGVECEVWLDDIWQHSTKQVTQRDPYWNEDCWVGIVAPKSMVRLQLKRGDDCLGFVEFCAVDMPINQELYGWFELRFQDNLQFTSKERYEWHKKNREDELVPHNYEKTKGLDRRNSKWAAPEDAPTLVAWRDRVPRQKYLKALSCCRPPEDPDGVNSDTVPDGVTARLNAGKLLLKVKLEQCAGIGWLDRQFAFALNTPEAFNYPSRAGNAKGLTDAELEGVSIQRIVDHAQHAKITFGEVYNCTHNYIAYIVRWNNCLLSVFVLATWVTGCVYPSLCPAIIPGCLLVLLLVNRSATVRRAMTRGGSNATLTEEGFAVVSEMDNANEMRKFCKRIANSLEVEFPDGEKAEAFKKIARRCFRDGRAHMDFSTLKREIRETGVQAKKKPLMKGTLVYVDNFHHATIMDVREEAGKTVITVEYDAAEQQQLGMKTEEIGDETDTRLIPRATVPEVATWFLPMSIKELLHKFDTLMRNLNGKTLPAVNKFAAMLSWDSQATMKLFITLAVSTALGTYYCLVNRWLQQEEELLYAEAHTAFLQYVEALDNILFFLIGIGLMTWNARWFVRIRSFGRIIQRMYVHKRRAPKDWAFFEEHGTNSPQAFETSNFSRDSQTPRATETTPLTKAAQPL